MPPAPGTIPERVHREVPHAREPEQIDELVRAFGEAARRCRDGGLDGIELPMAHNHLIELRAALRQGRRADPVPVLHTAGDCVAPRGVHQAILDGTRAARAT